MKVSEEGIWVKRGEGGNWGSCGHAVSPCRGGVEGGGGEGGEGKALARSHAVVSVGGGGRCWGVGGHVLDAVSEAFEGDLPRRVTS